VDLLGDRYKHVLLFSGGIGITPCQAILNELAAQAERGRPLRRIMLVWSVREQQMVDRWAGRRAGGALCAPDLQPLHAAVKLLLCKDGHRCRTTPLCPRRSVIDCSKHGKRRKSRSGGPPGSLPFPFTPDLVSDTIRRHSPASSPMIGTALVAGGWGGDSLTSTPTSLASSNMSNGDSLVQCEFYLTAASRPEKAGKKAGPMPGIAPELQHMLRFGRPDMPAIFDRMAQDAEACGESRVAVMVCGPTPMVKAVRDCCVAATKAGGISFDLHAEVFEF
jgi:hypothetical protein